jgi:hypothetical protein
MAIELPEEAEREALRVLEDNRMPIREWYVRGKKGTFQKRER